LKFEASSPSFGEISVGGTRGRFASFGYNPRTVTNPSCVDEVVEESTRSLDMASSDPRKFVLDIIVIRASFKYNTPIYIDIVLTDAPTQTICDEIQRLRIVIRDLRCSASSGRQDANYTTSTDGVEVHDNGMYFILFGAPVDVMLPVTWYNSSTLLSN
jgi:hypothetical protein